MILQFTGTITITDEPLGDEGFVRMVERVAKSWLKDGNDLPEWTLDDLVAVGVEKLAMAEERGLHYWATDYRSWMTTILLNAFRDYRKMFFSERSGPQVRGGLDIHEDADNDCGCLRKKSTLTKSDNPVRSAVELEEELDEDTVKHLLQRFADQLDAIEYIFLRLRAKGVKVEDIADDFASSRSRVQRKLSSAREKLGKMLA